MTAISPLTTGSGLKGRTVSAAARTAGRTRRNRTVPDQPNYVGIYASSIFAVTMVFLLGVGIPMAMVYGSAAGAGVGAFSAFWGGPSFGVMAASARVSTWHDKHDPDHS